MPSTSEYRSGLENRIADQLRRAKIKFTYETLKLSYVVPARNAGYTPDFILQGDIIVEAKGYFRTAADRQKLILVKKQHPDLDIRIVFQNANLPIYKGSKTKYWQWAETNGFPWADNGELPESWIHESQTRQKPSRPPSKQSRLKT